CIGTQSPPPFRYRFCAVSALAFFNFLPLKSGRPPPHLCVRRFSFRRRFCVSISCLSRAEGPPELHWPGLSVIRVAVSQFPASQERKGHTSRTSHTASKSSRRLNFLPLKSGSPTW